MNPCNQCNVITHCYNYSFRNRKISFCYEHKPAFGIVGDGRVFCSICSTVSHIHEMFLCDHCNCIRCSGCVTHSNSTIEKYSDKCICTKCVPDTLTIVLNDLLQFKKDYILTRMCPVVVSYVKYFL